MNPVCPTVLADGMVITPPTPKVRSVATPLAGLPGIVVDDEAAVQKAINDEFRNRARYSLAKSYEWQLKLEKARETYAMVEGAFADQAQSRARDLNRTSTHDFYDKYAQ